MGILSIIGGAINFLYTAARNLIKTIWRAIVDFTKEVVGYFRSLYLNPSVDVPFILAGEKLKDMIHNAPVRNCGIFEGVYNEETERITSARQVDAERLDAQTVNILRSGDEGLVVLQ